MKKNSNSISKTTGILKQTKAYFASENEDNSIQLNDRLTSELLYTSMGI